MGAEIKIDPIDVWYRTLIQRSPYWDPALAEDLAIMPGRKLRNLVEKIDIASQQKQVLVKQDIPHSIRIQRIHPDGKLIRLGSGNIWYSGVDYDVNFGHDQRLHLVNYPSGATVECQHNQDTSLVMAHTPHNETETMAMYKANRTGGMQLDQVTIGYGVETGNVARSVGIHKTRQMLNYDRVMVRPNGLAVFHYNGMSEPPLHIAHNSPQWTGLGNRSSLQLQVQSAVNDRRYQVQVH